MRLLYVCSDFGIPPSGTKGPSIHLRAITRALAELGHEVSLLSPKEGPGHGHPATGLFGTRCKPVTETARSLKRWLAERDLDEGVARELRPLLFNAWATERAQAALASDPPDAVIERLSLFGHIGLDLAQSLDRPLIVEVNAPLTREARTFRSLQLRTLAAEIETRVLERADEVIAVSAPLAASLAAGGVARRKIHVVPNGVDPRRFADPSGRDACRSALGLKGSFVMGFVGSLKPWHGVDVLLTAFGRIARRDPTARLLIVGTGTMETQLRETAVRMGLADAVVFTGAVPHERVPALLRAMDVAVAPFRSMEDFYFSPIKLFEYMAAGVCVVASRLGQIAEVIDDGTNGLLCAPDDAEDLAARLEQARESAELRARLALEALATVHRRYTWSRAGRATGDIVETAIQRAPIRRVAGATSERSGSHIAAASS